MPYIVVRNNDKSVLSRTSPDALLTWEQHPHYAVTFETYSGASKCAQMQGGDVWLWRDGGVRRLDDEAASRRRGLGPWVDGDSDFGLAL